MSCFWKVVCYFGKTATWWKKENNWEGRGQVQARISRKLVQNNNFWRTQSTGWKSAAWDEWAQHVLLHQELVSARCTTTPTCPTGGFTNHGEVVQDEYNLDLFKNCLFSSLSFFRFLFSLSHPPPPPTLKLMFKHNVSPFKADSMIQFPLSFQKVASTYLLKILSGVLETRKKIFLLFPASTGSNNC